MTVDIEAIRARADAATPGPWYWHDAMPMLMGGRCMVVMKPTRKGMQGATLLLRDTDNVLQMANSQALREHPDSAFIAAARTDVPQLCDEVDRLTKRLWRADELIRRLDSYTNDSDMWRPEVADYFNEEVKRDV